jgi:hypothetical protein
MRDEVLERLVPRRLGETPLLRREPERQLLFLLCSEMSAAHFLELSRLQRPDSVGHSEKSQLCAVTTPV